MLETIVEEKAVAGIAPVRSKENSKTSRLSAKMAAVVAGAGGGGNAAKDDTVSQDHDRNSSSNGSRNSSTSAIGAASVSEPVPVPEEKTSR